MLSTAIEVCLVTTHPGAPPVEMDHVLVFLTRRGSLDNSSMSPPSPVTVKVARPTVAGFGCRKFATVMAGESMVMPQ